MPSGGTIITDGVALPAELPDRRVDDHQPIQPGATRFAPADARELGNRPHLAKDLDDLVESHVVDGQDHLADSRLALPDDLALRHAVSLHVLARPARRAPRREPYGAPVTPPSRPRHRLVTGVPARGAVTRRGRP